MGVGKTVLQGSTVSKNVLPPMPKKPALVLRGEFNGRPAIFGVYRTGGAHSVVCKYLMGGDEYATYGFMDPNKTNTVYVNFNDPNLNPSNFVYANGLHTYPEWRYTRY